MEAILFQRHRVIATLIVLALFAIAVATAVFRISALEEAETSTRRQAAVEEAARLKADFEANKAAIEAAILAALDSGRFDDAGALLGKYRPVAGGALDALSARWEREKRPLPSRGSSGKGNPAPEPARAAAAPRTSSARRG